MTPFNSHPIQPEYEAPPGYIVFTKMKDGDQLDESISSFWFVMVIKEEMMPDDLRGARPFVRKHRAGSDRGRKYCAVWVIGEGRL
jgi:hypothetical protein